MPTQLDNRQVVQRAVLPMIGNAANENLSVLFPRVDAEMAKLFEDRNVLLVNGGIITYTGTQIQFTENLEITVNQRAAGGTPIIISLGMANVTLANGEMWYATIDRIAGTAVTAVATSLPAAIAANQEIFLLVKRVDAGDGTQRIYWRNGMALNAGQSVRLGASGSGSGGSGIGDDLIALLYRASFRDPFDEGPADSKSAVNVTAGFTDALTYSAAKAMYTLNYDASKTIAAATTTTNINLSANASFTVKIGDVVVANNQARRITAVANQASFTTEAFSVAPTLASQVTVSQAVHTKDIYNLPVDGNALSAAFPGESFSSILVDYEDTSAAGDNIFDVNVAPVIAFSASHDGTSYTDNKARPTLEMTQIQSVDLNAAGTALYLRLFALKTSGSGTVNVLGYRAFMQKSSVATSGGITNSAYGFTNGVGTPINATFSVVGGKTVVTLNWQYAVGVYAGTTASSIEVWVNGQKAPRFVDAILTPDLSFLETTSSSITLDKDYSSMNISVEIFQRTQIVDNSTINTTNISYAQEIYQNGFQAFVNQNQVMNATAVSGTPVAGSFYSSIIGRAPIVDLTQDLKVRMGIDRIVTQSVSVIQNESGSNGELVLTVPNDLFGQVRFVGSWSTVNDGVGAGAFSNLNNDFMEITFYGTGLNILGRFITGSADLRASVDGGAEGASFVPANLSNALDSRGYAPNIQLQVVSGLTLGVHTVRIRCVNSSSFSMRIYGFDTITDATTLKVNPGVGYANGKKIALSAIQSPAHNSTFDTGTLGTRGGRVVTYLKADGTVGKSVNPVGSQLNLAATDHSNEEVVRVYNWREFGANRADDFSTLTNAFSDRSFTLDDGTTSLFGTAQSGAAGGFNIQGSGSFYAELTFVGTGLDIFNLNAGSGFTDDISVDGVSVGTLTGLSIVAGWTKLVSGLPYGTHTVRITRAAGAALEINSFRIYQPKKPAIPSSAVELADYNLMANFVGATLPLRTDNRSTGVLAKSTSREAQFVGTWSASTPASEPLGCLTSSTTAGNYVEFYFFGTGINFIARSAGVTATSTIQIDGVAYTGAATTIGSGNSWVAGTSTFTMGAAANGNGQLQISGLALGWHRFRSTVVSGNNRVAAWEVQTPVHAPKSNVTFDMQNTLTVGSVGISDSRKLTPVKDILPGTKNLSQAVGITSGPTTNSTVLIPMPDMSTTINVKGNSLKLSFAGSFQNNNSTQGNRIQFFINGVAVGPTFTAQVNTTSQIVANSGSFVATVSPGTHKVDVYWAATSGTATAFGLERVLSVEEK